MSEKAMAAKGFLKRAYRVDQRINVKIEQLERLRALSCKVTSAYGGERVASSRTGSALESTVIRIIEAQVEINREIDALIDIKDEIRAVLRRVREPELQMLLEMRYLCFKSWSEIAVEMGYEDRYVYKVHGRALLEVEKILAARAVKDIE